MSTFYTTFLSKLDFSFILLLATFEPLEVEQSYIPLLKALVSGINDVGAQGCGCMFRLCHTSLKMGLLLHKTEIVCRVMLLSVDVQMILVSFFDIPNQKSTILEKPILSFKIQPM